MNVDQRSSDWKLGTEGTEFGEVSERYPRIDQSLMLRDEFYFQNLMERYNSPVENIY